MQGQEVIRYTETSTFVPHSRKMEFTWLVKDFDSFKWNKHNYLESNRIYMPEMGKRAFFRLSPRIDGPEIHQRRSLIEFIAEQDAHDRLALIYSKGNFSYRISVGSENFTVDESNTEKLSVLTQTSRHLMVDKSTLSLRFDITYEWFDKGGSDFGIVKLLQLQPDLKEVSDSEEFEVVDDSNEEAASEDDVRDELTNKSSHWNLMAAEDIQNKKMIETNTQLTAKPDATNGEAPVKAKAAITVSRPEAIPTEKRGPASDSTGYILFETGAAFVLYILSVYEAAFGLIAYIFVGLFKHLMASYNRIECFVVVSFTFAMRIITAIIRCLYYIARTLILWLFNRVDGTTEKAFNYLWKKYCERKARKASEAQLKQQIQVLLRKLERAKAAKSLPSTAAKSTAT